MTSRILPTCNGHFNAEAAENTQRAAEKNKSRVCVETLEVQRGHLSILALDSIPYPYSI